MKLSLTPRSHLRLLFWQFMQMGDASSHFRCRFLHVKHPVLTRFGLDALGEAAAAAGERLASKDSLWRLLSGSSVTLLAVEPLRNDEKVGSPRWCGLGIDEVVDTRLALRMLSGLEILRRFGVGTSK